MAFDWGVLGFLTILIAREVPTGCRSQRSCSVSFVIARERMASIGVRLGNCVYFVHFVQGCRVERRSESVRTHPLCADAQLENGRVGPRHDPTGSELMNRSSSMGVELSVVGLTGAQPV